MSRCAGVDGCPGGWLCIVLDSDTNRFRATVFRSAAELLAHDPTVQVMTIDMAIGLADSGRRRCDELARGMLGKRHVCVSNAPIRPALYAPTRLAASGITKEIANREVGSNEWALYPKIINLDIAIAPSHQNWCFEIHPELCFREWNDGVVIQSGKNSEQGRRARETLIDAAWPGARQQMLASMKEQGINRKSVALHDLSDAFAALWTSLRIAAGKAKRIPDTTEVDARGLRMQMWY